MWSGLKVTSSLVEAQCCLLSINSEVEKGTDALFTIQTRSEETNIPQDILKDQYNRLIESNFTIKTEEKTSSWR